MRGKNQKHHHDSLFHLEADNTISSHILGVLTAISSLVLNFADGDYEDTYNFSASLPLCPFLIVRNAFVPPCPLLIGRNCDDKLYIANAIHPYYKNHYKIQ